MEGNPYGDINKEQKKDSKNSKQPEGTFVEPPGIFFFVYEHYY